MCFRRKTEQVEQIVKEHQIIRKTNCAGDVIAEIVEEKQIDTKKDIYVIVPSNFSALVDIEGVEKQLVGEGTNLISMNPVFDEVQGRIVYVNCNEIITVFWGTEQYDYMDSVLKMPIRMAFRGSAQIKIVNADKFVSSMLGNKKILTVGNIDEYFVPIIATHVMKVTADVMITAGISYVEYASHILEITKNVSESVKDLLLENYGIGVHNFTIEPPYYADRAAMENMAKDLEIRRRLELRGSDFATEEDKIVNSQKIEHEQKLEEIKAASGILASSRPVVNIYQGEKRCANCGSIVENSACFCSKCGTRIE